MNKFNVAHELITSHRLDSELLWVPGEKHLYFMKDTLKSGKEDWICYQEMLCKKKCQPSEGEPFDLTHVHRVFRDPTTQTCTRKRVEHTHHENHELIYDDLMSRHEIYSDALRFRDAAEGLSVKVPVTKIVTRTLAK